MPCGRVGGIGGVMCDICFLYMERILSGGHAFFVRLSFPLPKLFRIWYLLIMIFLISQPCFVHNSVSMRCAATLRIFWDHKVMLLITAHETSMSQK